jgi:nucleoside 2-deoxyribosyltransferase
MKIYIAASFNSAERIYEQALELESIGHTVTGVWFQPHDPIEKMWDGNFGGRVAEVMAVRDLHHIKKADLMVIDTLDPSSTGGRNVELGYAIGLGKRVILIGKAENVFMSLINECYDDWEEFYENLDEVIDV